jgi:hypothetical protein
MTLGGLTDGRSCDFCGKVFSKRSNLLQHRRSMHLGIFPYMCQTCGKGFANKSNLNGHAFTHTGEKTYKCNICGSCFQWKASLEKHQKKIHPGADLLWKDGGRVPQNHLKISFESMRLSSVLCCPCSDQMFEHYMITSYQKTLLLQTMFEFVYTVKSSLNPLWIIRFLKRYFGYGLFTFVTFSATGWPYLIIMHKDGIQ